MTFMQMQQKRFLQQKHSFKTNASNDIKKFIVSCRMQRRTSILKTTPSPSSIRQAIKTIPTTTTATTPIITATTTTVEVDTVRTETRDITTHCNKLNETTNSIRAGFVPNLLSAKKHFRCDNLKLTTTPTPPSKRSLFSFLAPQSVLHKNSMQNHGNNNATCSSSPIQQHVISKKHIKHCRLLLYFLLLVLQTFASLAAFSVFLQRCRQQQQIASRKYYSFLLWSYYFLLCVQLLALTPPARAQRGSSLAEMGSDIETGTALTTTPNFGQHATDTHLHMKAKHSLQDAELAAKLQKVQSSKKNSNNTSVKNTLATDVSLSDGRSLVDLINRDNVLDRAHVSQLSVTQSPAPNSGGCQSCHMREKAKLENLESIKEHILIRLKLSKLPNITTIQVPHDIIESFYKISYQKKLRPVISTTTGKRSGLERHTGVSNSKDAVDVMQGDEPQTDSWNEYIYAESDEQHFPDDVKEEEAEYEDGDFEEDFYSRVNSVYVFPTTPRIRHNRKHEILNFRLDWNDTTITRTIVNVYIRGYNWIREYNPALLMHYLRANNRLEKPRDIVVTVHRVVRRRNTTRVTHTIKISETRHKVPNGEGKWVQIDVKQLPSVWTANRNETQGLVIRGLEPWMRPLIVTSSSGSEQNKVLRAFIEVFTKDERKTRRKRSNSLDCSERDNEVRCCRYPLRVNFTNFGWNWVVAPTSFNAYFCNGECKLGFLEKHAHTHLASLSTSAQPCCSPTKMSALRLLYFNSDQMLVLSTIPNMSVEKCSCS